MITYQVPTIDNLFTFSNNDYIIIDGIDFTGANSNAIVFNSANADHNIIRNSNITFSGINGISGGFNTQTDLLVDNCSITDSNSSGIIFPSSTGLNNSTVSNSNILRAGLFPGHLNTSSSAGWGVGIKMDGASNTFFHNIVTLTGSIGIKYFGSNSLIDKNLITSALQSISDLGSIYSFNSSSTSVPTTTTGIVISNNIILSAGPSPYPGDTTHSDGIYLDNNTNGISCINNTVAFCINGSGFLCNYPDNSSLTFNTIYSCFRNININNSKAQSIIDNFDVSNNISVVTDSTQQANLNGGTTSSTTLGTCTISIASPAVISLTNHRLSVNDLVKFTTSGSLPTGINTSTTYHVISSGFGSNSFEISTSSGGSAVNTSGSQSGTQTLIKNMPIDLTYDHNVYSRPSDTTQSTSKMLLQGGTSYTLSGWQSAFSSLSWDVHSATSPVAGVPNNSYFNYNASDTPLVITPPGSTYVEIKTGTAYPTTYTIPAWSSVVLVKP